MIKKVNLNESAGRANMCEYLRVGTLNGHMLNVLRVQKRKLDFHVHPDSDELFYCIEGEFDMDFEDGTEHIVAGDLIIVPKGTRHRPNVTTPVKCLLIEDEGTLDQSNTGGSYTGQHEQAG